MKNEKTLNEKLKEAIKLVEEAEGIDIDGKQYTTIAERISILRKVFGFDLKITNIQKFYDGTECQFESRIYFKDGEEWIGVANGFSCEKRNANEVNLNSVVEIAETSAVGRALGFLGLGGSSISTGEEVKNAKQKTKNKPKVEKHVPSSKKRDKLIEQINFLIKENDFDEKQILTTYKVKDIKELKEDDLRKVLEILNAGLEQDGSII